MSKAYNGLLLMYEYHWLNVLNKVKRGLIL